MCPGPLTGTIPTDSSGSFRRRGPRFTDRIVASSSGEEQWPVESGRYRLVVSLACPWAHRSVIVRRLMGLEDAISLAITDPIQDERSWRFTLDPDDVDPVLGYRYLGEAYDARDPENGTENGVSVPAIVDVPRSARSARRGSGAVGIDALRPAIRRVRSRPDRCRGPGRVARHSR